MTFKEWWDKREKSLASPYRKDVAEAAWKAAQPQWQSIESAPKDGTEVILYVGDEVFTGKWINKENYKGEVGWHESQDYHELWHRRSPLKPDGWMMKPEVSSE